MFSDLPKVFLCDTLLTLAFFGAFPDLSRFEINCFVALMQGRRSAVGSLPDTLGFDQGSTPSDAGIDQQICWNNMQNSAQNRLSDYMSPSNTSITYLNSVSEEEQNLSGWSIGEPSSTNIQNHVSHNERRTERGWSSSMNACAEVSPVLEERRFEPANIFSLNSGNVDLSSSQIPNGPLFPPSSSSDSIPQDCNISSGFVGPPSAYKSSSSQNMWVPSSSSSSDPFGVPSGSGGYLEEENDARPGCGLEGNRLSCKRKALEGNIGQSSGSGSSNYYQRAEGSVWHGVPARRNASRSLCISTPSESTLRAGPLEQVNQGLGLGVGGVSSESPLPLNAPGSAESSRRNFRLRINASHQQESTPTHAVPHQSSRLLPLNNSLNLRSPPPADSTSPHDQFVTVRRNLQSSRWNRSSISRPSSSNSGISGERNAAPLEESTTRTMPRNISEHPMFVPASGIRNSAQNPVNWGVSGGNINLGGNVASASRTGSSSGVHPSPAAPNWVPHRNPPHYPRRLAEFVRRSLLSSSGSEPGGEQSSNISGTSASSSQEMSLPSGEQGQHLSHSRSAVLLDRQLDAAFGIPYSMRSLATGSEGGRSRLSEVCSSSLYYLNSNIFGFT